MKQPNHIVGSKEKSCISANCERCRVRMDHSIHLAELPDGTHIYCAECCPDCRPRLFSTATAK